MGYSHDPPPKNLRNVQEHTAASIHKGGGGLVPASLTALQPTDAARPPICWGTNHESQQKRWGHGGAAGPGPAASHPPAICQKLGGGGGGSAGVFFGGGQDSPKSWVCGLGIRSHAPSHGGCPDAVLDPDTP